MTEKRVPRRDFLTATASTALTFGAGLPATAQTSASAPSSPSPTFSTAQPADFILKNAKVITVDANFSIAQAIAIAGERIVAVGEDAAMAAHATAADPTAPRHPSSGRQQHRGDLVVGRGRKGLSWHRGAALGRST